MEGLLRSQEMAEIEEIYRKAYDLDSGIVFFPVRHHSPACTFHLRKVVDAYSPEIILIEGPADTNDIVRYIAHDESEAPLCIYYSYGDKKGLLGEKDGKYMCYYPFLDYSPELAAIREAKARSIEARFIDLPYAEILLHSGQGAGLHTQAPKISYNDDYLIQRSRFLQEICRREGCRNFSELWEKLYEMDGIHMDTGSFVRNMLAFCYFSRVDQTEEMLAAEGCIAREKFMAANIKEAAAKYKRILVVTGGFHTWGLLQLMQKAPEEFKRPAEPMEAGAYAMAYSFEECDQLNGYASGMPYPAFYQKVWEAVCDHEEKPYEKAALHFIVRSGSRLRKNDAALSTADQIEAYNMAKGLAGLRSKPECGVFELLDGVRAAFVKGELTEYDKAPLEVLRRLLTGRKTGKLCGDAEVPPIVKDFREKSRQLRLKYGTTVEQELVLDIYKNTRHREVSRFLHMMAFLDTDFCKRLKGPDFVNKKNTSMVRETWKYRWSPHVESSLIEISVYGGSLEEAASAFLKKRLGEAGEHSGEVSILMIDAFMMGLEDSFDELADRVSNVICKDGVFFSTAECTYNMAFLCGAGRLLGPWGEGRISRLAGEAYSRTAFLTYGIHNTPEDEENKVIARLKDIYQIALQADLGLDSSIFSEALTGLVERNDCNSAVEGASIGLLLGLNRMDRNAVLQKTEGYLYGTGEKFLKSAGFLKGLFSTARDVVFYDDAFLRGIDHVLKEMQQEEFMKIIPDLRLSFSFFLPNEIDDIGRTVAGIYNTGKDELLKVKALDPQDVILGSELDAESVEMLRRWGLADE